MNELYSRFEIARPDYLGDDHWACIEREADRLWRSLAAGDGSQALSDIKCLVESISRIVLEIDGTPSAPNTAFDTVVTQAHTLLTGQPGHDWPTSPRAVSSRPRQARSRETSATSGTSSAVGTVVRGHPISATRWSLLPSTVGCFGPDGRCAGSVTSRKAVRPH